MNAFDPNKIVQVLKAQFKEVNTKYEEMMNLMTQLCDIPENKQEAVMLRAANLWHEVKQDKIFLEMVYEKNKDAMVREGFKKLDEVYELINDKYRN